MLLAPSLRVMSGVCWYVGSNEGPGLKSAFAVLCDSVCGGLWCRHVLWRHLRDRAWIFQGEAVWQVWACVPSSCREYYYVLTAAASVHGGWWLQPD